MEKYAQKAITGILLVAVFTLMATSSCRAEANSTNLTDLSLDNMQAYLKATGQEGFSLNRGIKVPAVPEFVGWTNWGEIYLKGGIDVQIMGNSLLVKVGFIRGTFDSYTKTYKAEPVITLQNESAMAPYLRSGQSNHYILGTQDVYAEFMGQSVRIINYTNASEEVTISCSDLLAKWATYASDHCAKHLDKTYCLVPQILWNGSYKQYGWVTTENKPLYYTTSTPQDYVDLYKQLPPNYVNEYRPTAYSLALRLAFVLSPSQADIWEIRQMTAEEAGDAMVDESKNHKNIFTPSSLNVTGIEVVK